MAKHYVSSAIQTGEGWFLTGEMLELIRSGTIEHHLHPAVRLPAKPHHGKGVIKDCAPAIRRKISSP